MGKPLISDESQRDPKERDHLGVGRHERLWFSMSPVGGGTAPSVPAEVERLVMRLMARGKGSYISSVLRDCTVRVEVLNLGVVWKWEVKKGHKVTDEGIATLHPDRGLELEGL